MEYHKWNCKLLCDYNSIYNIPDKKNSQTYYNLYFFYFVCSILDIIILIILTISINKYRIIIFVLLLSNVDMITYDMYIICFIYIHVMFVLIVY